MQPPTPNPAPDAPPFARGRPARREHRLELALSPAERETIEAAAAAAGHRPAAWLRHVALHQAPPPPRRAAGVRVPAEARDLLQQLAPLASDLRGLAGNTNQLVRHLNEAAASGRLPDLNTAARAIKTLIAIDQRLDLVRDEIKRLQLLLLNANAQA